MLQLVGCQRLSALLRLAKGLLRIVLSRVGIALLRVGLLGVLLLSISLRLLRIKLLLALRVWDVVGVGLDVLGAGILRALRPWLLCDEGVLGEGYEKQSKSQRS